MFKKIILSVLVLVAGIGMLYFRPLRISEDPAALISSKTIQKDLAQYKDWGRPNQMTVILTDTQQDIFNPVFLNTLQKLADDIFYLPDVDRTHMLSIFTRNLNFNDVIEDGFEATSLIPEDFSNSVAQYSEIKNNLLKSPYLGRLVSYDFKSAAILVPYYGAENGRRLVQDIEGLFPTNTRVRFSIVGYAPFGIEVSRALERSLLALLLTGFLSSILFCLVTRKIIPFFFLLFCPVLTVIFVCAISSFLPFSFHPMVLPIVVMTWLLSFIDVGWLLLNSKRNIWAFNGTVLWPLLSLLFLGSAFGYQMASLVLIAALSLFLSHQLFLWLFASLESSVLFWRWPVVQIRSSRTQNLWLIFLLIAGLSLSSNMIIGNSGLGPSILKDSNAFLKAQKLASDGFSFSLNSIIVLAVSNKGCTDYATISTLEDFHWNLKRLPSVRSVRNIADVVKKLNVFFNENNLKWKTIPQEKKSLIATTSAVDPFSGLFDHDCLMMPITIFLENQNPQILARVYNDIKNYRSDENLLFLKVVGGTAGMEAIYNDELASSVKMVFIIFLLVIFLVTVKAFNWKTALRMSFIFFVILSLTWGLMALLKIGLTVDTLVAMGLGTSLCLYFLWTLQRHPGVEQKLGTILILTCLALSGGLLSEINFIFRSAVIIESMVVLTWLIGFPAISGENDS